MRIGGSACHAIKSQGVDDQGRIEQSAEQETATSAPRGSLVGNYDASAQILSAHIRWSF
jgi:hypothetical protein